MIVLFYDFIKRMLFKIIGFNIAEQMVWQNSACKAELSYEIQDQPFEDAADLLLRWYILPVRLLYWGAKCSGGDGDCGKEAGP